MQFLLLPKGAQKEEEDIREAERGGALYLDRSCLDVKSFESPKSRHSRE